MFVLGIEMVFRKLIGGLLLLPCVSVFAAEDKTYPGMTSTQIGFQNVSYKETLADFATIGDLSTDISVTNAVIYTASYTHLFDKWGLYMNSQASLSQDVTADSWEVEGFGPVQKNNSKVHYSDLVAQGAYHFTDELLFTFGGQAKTLSFTRWDFEAVQPAADDLNVAIQTSDKYKFDPNPPKVARFEGAIQEDLNFFNGVVGVYYNSAFRKNRSRLNFFASGTFAVPVYYSAQNSALSKQYDLDSITGSFNGYEAHLSGGVSFEIKKGLAVTFTTDYMMSAFDEINTSVKGSDNITRTAAIPNIDLTSLQFSLGLTWIN